MTENIIFFFFMALQVYIKLLAKFVLGSAHYALPTTNFTGS